MRLVEFSLAHRIPVACFSCHKINKISISWLNYNRKQEILLKNLPQNQSNLKANGIYSCTGIYFFKSATNYFRCSWQYKLSGSSTDSRLRKYHTTSISISNGFKVIFSLPITTSCFFSVLLNMKRHFFSP